MKISEILRQKDVTISFEVFPPKTDDKYAAVEQAARPGVPDGPFEDRKRVGAEGVVGVEKDKILPDGARNGIAARRHQPAVFLVKDADAGILRGVLVADRAAVVGGAVVHQQQLKVLTGLPENGISFPFSQLDVHLKQ